MGMGMLFSALSAGGNALADSVTASRKVDDERSLMQERAALEETRMLRMDEVKRGRDREDADYKRSIEDGPMNRLGASVAEIAQRDIPVTADPITKLSGRDPNSGLPEGDPNRDGMGLDPAKTQDLIKRIQALPDSDPNKAPMLAQLRRQAESDQAAAQEAVAGKTRKPIANEAMAIAMQEALKKGDMRAYKIAKELTPEKTLKVGKDETILDAATLKPIFANSLGQDREDQKEDRRDARDQSREDRRDERERRRAAAEGDKPQYVETEDGIVAVPKNLKPGQAPVGTPVVGADGKPLKKSKPLTEAQGNAVSLGMRAIQAEKDIANLTASGFDALNIKDRMAGSTPLDVGRGLMSDEGQQYENAQRNFISAVLRKESGAAISNSEFDNEKRKYFPQIGDGENTKRQKAKSRALAVEGLRAMAGPSGDRMIKDAMSAEKKVPAPTTGLKFLGFE